VETRAREAAAFAERTGAVYLSTPTTIEDIGVQTQGTIGFEIIEQCPQLRTRSWCR